VTDRCEGGGGRRARALSKGKEKRKEVAEQKKCQHTPIHRVGPTKVKNWGGGKGQLYFLKTKNANRS